MDHNISPFSVDTVLSAWARWRGCPLDWLVDVLRIRSGTMDKLHNDNEILSDTSP